MRAANSDSCTPFNSFDSTAGHISGFMDSTRYTHSRQPRNEHRRRTRWQHVLGGEMLKDGSVVHCPA